MPVIKINDDSFQAVPVFPLKGIYLFPNSTLYLRIFEPRYLDMLEYALEHEHLIAVADLENHDQNSRNGRLASTLGAGLITEVQPLADGSKYILLDGITRLTLIEERPQIHAFRQVRAKILIDEQTEQRSLYNIDYKVRSLLFNIKDEFSNMQSLIHDILEKAPTPNALSNMLSAHLVRDHKLKRYLFEEINPHIRLEHLFEDLADLCIEVLSDQNDNLYH